MKLLVTLSIAASLAFASTSAFAGGISSGLPSNILVLPDNNLVFFSAGDHTGKPSCATNGTGTWAIDTSTGGGRAMYAAILTALAIEKSITVEGYGTGVCDRESSRESARFFYFSE